MVGKFFRIKLTVYFWVVLTVLAVSFFAPVYFTRSNIETDGEISMGFPLVVKHFGGISIQLVDGNGELQEPFGGNRKYPLNFAIDLIVIFGAPSIINAFVLRRRRLKDMNSK